MAVKREVRRVEYNEIRDLLQPGDIVAFGGTGLVSKVIKLVTRSKVSHVGIVFHGEGDKVEVLESTTLEGHFKGVQAHRLSECIENYPGEVWILRLREDIRARIYLPLFEKFCRSQIGKPYDKFQAVLSGLKLPQAQDYSKLYCSEVAASGLKIFGIPSFDAPSGPTPAKLVNYDIYEPTVYQVKGVTCQL